MWKEILVNSFKGIWEWFILVLSIVIPVGVSVFPNSPIISFVKSHPIILLLILLLCFISLAVSIRFLITTLSIIEKHKNVLPKLKIIDEDYYIFEPSEIFTQRSYVLLYHDGDSQRKIALGMVDMVQDTGKKIQVKIISDLSEKDKAFISRNKSKIILKPTITTDELSIDQLNIQGVSDEKQ